MTIKDVLVHVDRGPASQARVETAMTLAERMEAHATALCLIAEPFLPAMVGVHIPAEILNQQLAEAEREADAILQAVGETARRRGLPVDLRRESGPVDRLPGLLARQARHVDLVIVGQPDPDTDSTNGTLIAEAAFMNSGRPALVIPYIGAGTFPPKRVIVGWDGSREAARAVNDALPFLQMADEVVVLIVDPEALGARVGEAAGADIAAHLARHGVKVDLKQVRTGGLAVGDVILSQASDEEADLLVMGGYGHSRLRELVLGGVTRHLLERMTVPVLFAH